MAMDTGAGTWVGSRSAEHRLVRRGVDGAEDGRPGLTVEQILAWADAHYAATGCWPVPSSGAVDGAPGESWDEINQALNEGGRGLPDGSTLAHLLAEHRDAPPPEAVR